MSEVVGGRKALRVCEAMGGGGGGGVWTFGVEIAS